MLYFKISTEWTIDEWKTKEAGKRLEKSKRKRETKVFVQANDYQCFKDFVLYLSLFLDSLPFNPGSNSQVLFKTFLFASFLFSFSSSIIFILCTCFLR